MTLATLRRTLLDMTALNDAPGQSVHNPDTHKTNLAKLGSQLRQEKRASPCGCCSDRHYWLGRDLSPSHIGVIRPLHWPLGNQDHARRQSGTLAAARSSTTIPSKTNRKVLAAQEHAYMIGHSLDCFVTVHWEWTRFANRDRYAAVKALRKKEQKWIGEREMRFHDICVRENPPQIGSRPSNGEHFHQALSLPLAQWEPFKAELNKWLGSTDAARALVIKPINDRNLVRWYFMKAGTKAVRRDNGIPDTPKFSRHQGKIVGRRVIISYSLNHKAITGALGVELAKEVLAPKPIKRLANAQALGSKVPLGAVMGRF